MLSGRFMSAMPSSDIFDNDNSGLSRQFTAFIRTSLSCGTWFEYSNKRAERTNVINNSQQQCKLLNRTNFLTSISVPRISAAVPWIAGSWSFSLSKDNFRHVCVHEWLPLFLLNENYQQMRECCVDAGGKLVKIAFSVVVVSSSASRSGGGNMQTHNKCVRDSPHSYATHFPFSSLCFATLRLCKSTRNNVRLPSIEQTEHR